MNTIKNKNYDKIKWILFMSAIFVQIAFFIIYYFKGDIYCDEAMTILNARSLVEKGTDIMGEKLPVYFDTWLYGGQSPFATYIVALFIKIFGYSLVITRMPILIMQTMMVFALYFFAKEIFSDEKYAIVTFAVAAFSPWKLIQSSWTLDCAFLSFFIVFGLMFLSKAMNGKKCSLNYTLSMIFFGLGFYCYIASVLIIPILLVSVYLLMMIKKQIKFKYVLLSVGVIFIVALPFLLFGLVSTGIIDDFSLFGFSFSSMKYYSRGSDVVFIGRSFIDIILDGITNLVFSFVVIFVPDSIPIFYSNIENAYADINIFALGHTVGGICAFLGLLIIIRALIKKKSGYKLPTKIMLTSLIITVLFFCFTVCGSDIGTTYRYGIIYVLLFVFESIFIVRLVSKKKIIKTIFPIFMAISVIATGLEFFSVFTSSFALYYNSLNATLTYTEQQNIDENIVFVNNCNQSYKPYYLANQNEAVFIRFRNFDKIDNYCSLETDLLNRGVMSGDRLDNDLYLSNDKKWVYKNAKGLKIEDDCYIISNDTLPTINYDKSNYDLKNFGYYNVISKK